MRLLTATAVSSVLLAAPAAAQEIEVTPLRERPSQVGPDRLFTGAAVIDPLFSPTEHRASAAKVAFAPGARTAWHSHPAGQVLVVTSGEGWVQAWGQERRKIGAGDVVWTPPGVKHWHGATVTHGMSHIAIQQAVDGEVVQWLEHVTDEQYGGD